VSELRRLLHAERLARDAVRRAGVRVPPEPTFLDGAPAGEGEGSEPKLEESWEGDGTVESAPDDSEWGSDAPARKNHNDDGEDVDAAELARKLGAAVLLKGGHGEGDELVDLLVDAGGRALATRRAARVAGIDTHGSGCTLSAALAARLALGDSLSDAFMTAHAYLQGGLAGALSAGPRRQIRHLP
jgi:hydroxymethylpyrimidine/phosphomethylpyrimidine kinase